MSSLSSAVTISIPSPLGPLVIEERDGRVVRIDLGGSLSKKEKMRSPLLKKVEAELRQYFEGERKEFSIPLKLIGTDFQVRVWKALLRIPFGAVWTYSDIAKAIGQPRASRAVGGAIGKNPIGLVVPCHRVCGKDGSLTGFSAGIVRKKWLLHHEQKKEKSSLSNRRIA